MQLTFPHLGEAYLYARLLFKELGVPLTIPPLNSTASLERGSGVSPEEICLPFKLMAGNLLEAWEAGADTVLMPATMGPCRLGQYGELLQRILRKEGCRYRWILLDSPAAIGYRELIRRADSVLDGRKISGERIFSALRQVAILVKDFEEVRRECRLLCGSYRFRGLSASIYREAETLLKTAGDLQSAGAAMQEKRREVRRIKRSRAEETERREEVSVLVTGEIYSCIEPFANHHIADLLEQLNVSFAITPTIGWWIGRTFHLPGCGAGCKKPLVRGGDSFRKERIPCEIGGYARDTVDSVLRAADSGFDGVIQIFPSGCMPEIVAKSVFDRTEHSREIPVLSLIFDEMGGEAGYITRVEAFADLLQRKKRRSLQREYTKKRGQAWSI
ncbi:MAG: hypothetical protein SOY83_05040 [Anaerovoracaceae bacterium]|nr:hypothetical protein [Anaerovoracaceae bacterium]